MSFRGFRPDDDDDDDDDDEEYTKTKTIQSEGNWHIVKLSLPCVSQVR